MMANNNDMTKILLLVVVAGSCCLSVTGAFSVTAPTTTTSTRMSAGSRISSSSSVSKLFSMVDDDAPSDYDAADLPGEKSVAVDTDEDDAVIRDALKRELLLMSSVTNRGMFASSEEKDIMIDIIAQLEALNPTADPASHCEGEWDLCLSSTQFFRTSPFFQTIRAAVGDDNKMIAENGFSIHNRATAASRVGRVRQKILPDQLVSEVDLEVGLLPGLPVRVKGTVVTTASLDVTSSETWELKIEGTRVKGSDIPLLNQLIDDPALELPVGQFYSTVMENVPIVTCKTFYVDEGIRITRDVDNNFFVYSRA